MARQEIETAGAGKGSGSALAIREPESALANVKRWAKSRKPTRKRWAAEASRDHDADQLLALLSAYLQIKRGKGRTDGGVSRNTRRTYGKGAARLVDWCQSEGILPHQITEDESGAWLASLKAEGLKDKTRAVYLTGARTLVAALRWAGLGDGDPFDGRGVTIRDTESPMPYFDHEIDAMIGAARTDRDPALILLGAQGGLRLAEAAALRWESVNLDRGGMVIEGKGGKVAEVLMTGPLADALRALDPKRSGSVFGISHQRVAQIGEGIADRAGVDWRGYHALRHSCGVHLLLSTGGNLKMVQEHLRHASIDSTVIYVKWASRMYGGLRREIEAFGNFSPNGHGPEADRETA